MKRKIGGVLIASTLAACSQIGTNSLGDARLNSSAFFTDSDLGDIEGGLADTKASLQPLLRNDGVPLVGEVTGSAQVVTNVADNRSTPIEPGAKVALIAKNGDFVRILAKVNINGTTRLVEGFIRAADMKFLGAASDGFAIDLNPDTPAVTAAGAQSGATKNPNEGFASGRVVPGTSNLDYNTTGSGSNASAGQTLGSGQGSSAYVPAATENPQPRVQPATPANTLPPAQLTTAAQPPAPPTPAPPAPAPPTPAPPTPVPPTPAPPTPAPPAPPSEIKENKFTKSNDLATGSCTKVVFHSGSGNKKINCSNLSAGNAIGGVKHFFSGCMVPGEMFRDPQKSSYFEITAQGTKMRVLPTASHYGCKDKQDCKEDVKTVYVPSIHEISAGQGVHNINLTKILKDETDLRNGTRTFKFEPIDQSGNVTGSCTIFLSVSSPIVLDLEGVDSFDGIPLGKSSVDFDLLGNGQKVRTGWLAPSMGLLALDHNRDGKISDGSELFGEGSRNQNAAGARNFTNGYEALAQYDVNKDGSIDARDPVYPSLLVWRDSNSDGVSQAGELVALSSLGITRLSVLYGPSLRHGVPEIGQNDARFEARYFGPARCGDTGCMSFDVFFATANALAAK
jgi:hypothetical protein